MKYNIIEMALHEQTQFYWQTSQPGRFTTDGLISIDAIWRFWVLLEVFLNLLHHSGYEAHLTMVPSIM